MKATRSKPHETIWVQLLPLCRVQLIMQTRRIQASRTAPARAEINGGNEANDAERDQQPPPDAVPADPGAAERLLTEQLLREKDAMIARQDARIARLERSVNFFQGLTHRHQDLMEKQLSPSFPAASTSVVSGGTVSLAPTNPRQDSILGSFWGGILQQIVWVGVPFVSLWMASQFRRSHDHVGFALLLAAAVLNVWGNIPSLLYTIRRKEMPAQLALISNLATATSGLCALGVFLRMLWSSTSVHPNGHHMFIQICAFEAVLLTIMTMTVGTLREAVKSGLSLQKAAAKQK